MISKLRAFASLFRELGPRWMLFRLAYGFRLRTGLIRLQMPMGEWSDYKNLISTNPAGREVRWLSSEAYRNQQVPWDKQPAIIEADRLLNGELKYFSHQFIKTDFPPDWHKDYFSNHVILSRNRGEGSLLLQSENLRSAQSDMRKHWSQISDDSSTDIKFIWELNRFAFVYTLVRAYAATQDEKYPQAFWTL
ncbi:MAG TPA: hypothetical protein VLA72_12295, partial [Anaerolineales bacterium]|nr:hypothetical protein [Anaerolineales bacterium]